MSKNKITVKLWDSSQTEVLSTLQLNIDPEKMIRNVSENINYKSVQKIREIRFNGKLLNLDDSCKSCGLKDGCTLDVICDTDNNIINLLVEMASVNGNRNKLKVSVNPNITTEELIEEIKKKAPFGVDASYMVCRHITLQIGKSLLSQDIKNNDTIQVLTRVRGG